MCLCHVSLTSVAVLPQNALVQQHRPSTHAGSPGLLHCQKERGHLPFSAVAPCMKMFFWPPAGPRCEGSKAVRRGDQAAGAGRVQRAAAHHCLLVPAGFQTPFPGGPGHAGGWGRQSRALSGPIPVLSPSMLLLTVSFSSFPAEPLSPYSTLFTLHATPPPAHLWLILTF